ncbi:MAG TPA: hypothetical protein ENH40_00970 [Nitrospirae bacterium]|nr:hypothetical protein [Nitrospirota bacterium]
MEDSQDLEHLRLLSIFHYVVGGIGALFALFPIIHLLLGLAFIFSPETFPDSNTGEPPPQFVGYLFAALGGLFFILGEIFAFLVIYSGIQIKKRKKYTFSFVIACILCMFIPFGTALGIFSIIVLSRNSVKQIYGKTVPAGQ